MNFVAEAPRRIFYPFALIAFEILHPNQPLILAPHIEALAYALEQVAFGREKRLLVTIPPRHLKSMLTSVSLAAWILGRDPSCKIVVASYGSELAEKHSRDFRRLTQSPLYRQLFPHYAESPGCNRADEIETTRGGGRKAICRGGAATGFGADVIIIDDIMKAGEAHSPAMRDQAKQFVSETLMSRLNNPEKGTIVAIQQRLHDDDIVQHLLDTGNWRHISMPAIAEQQQSFPLYNGQHFTRNPGDILAPNFISEERLRALRTELGEFAFSAQYQQNPIPPGGNRVNWEWFGMLEDMPTRENYDHVVQSWDTATSNSPDADYSVCMTFGYHEGDWDMIDIFRERLNFPDLKRAALRLIREYEPRRVIIEDASSGRALQQELREHFKQQSSAFQLVRPGFSKEERLDLQSAKIEEGVICLPQNAPWLPAFKQEILGFPNMKHDDQVDALTLFLEWISDRRGKAFLNTDPRTGRPRQGARPRGTDYSSFGRSGR